MNRQRFSRMAGVICCLMGIACLVPPPILGCGMVLSDPVPVPVYVSAERAVIIWDQVHHVEHFIRQASIATKDADIGFLVPTPQTPELAEADNRIFDLATSVGQPTKIAPTNYHSLWSLMSPVVMSSYLQLNRLTPAALFSGMSELKSHKDNLTVLAEHDVAGYHATILEANDEAALSAWLTANGYLATPEIKEWLRPYVAGKWKITAFKLIKRDDGPLIVTRAIRMTFPTDRPFYPYSEPSDRQQAANASPGGRALQVTVLSDSRMTGTLTDDSAWPGKLEFSGPTLPSTSPNAAAVKQWSEYAGLNTPSSHDTTMPAKLTTFLDESNPRPGTADLYFSPDQVQDSFKGEMVDLNTPPQDRLIISPSLTDFTALLVLLILPIVPLYCGWKVLNQWPDDANNPLSPQRLSGLPSRPQSKYPRTLKNRLMDGLVGVVSIILGLFYGGQFILLLLTEIASALLHWSNTGGNWGWIFAGIAAATMVAVFMSWGMIFCGVNVLRLRAVGIPLRRTNFFYAEGAWQGFMGASSLFAGCLASVAVMGVVVSLLSL